MPTSTQIRTPSLKFSYNTAGVEGDIAEILQKLLPPEKVVRIARAGGDIIANAWRILELPHNVTGEYQATIQVLIDDAGTDYAIIAVGTTARQARFLEYGTSKQEPQPVMRPAYDMSKEAAVTKMYEVMRQT